MFTKIGVTVAAGAFPVLLWAGAAGAQQSQSQSQSESTAISTVTTLTTATGGGGTGGTLARTGDNSLLPLAIGGMALGGAVVARRGLRRRSLA